MLFGNMDNSKLWKKSNGLILLKKLEVHYIKKLWVYVTWYTYSNQNNNLKFINIKTSLKIYIYSKFDFY